MYTLYNFKFLCANNVICDTEFNINIVSTTTILKGIQVFIIFIWALFISQRSPKKKGKALVL